MKRTITALAVIVCVSGCASTQHYQPIVDSQGVDHNQYQSDLAACHQYAGQINPAERAAGGAVAGAVLGAVLAGILGGSGRTVGQVAGAYGVVGGASGAASGAAAQRTIVLRCMAGRGYKVLY